MSKILFIALPLSSAMNAVLKLAHTLRGRGHEVVFVGMADSRAVVESGGFECVPVFTDWFPEGFIRQSIHGSLERPSWRDHVRIYREQRRKMIEHENFVEYLIRGGYRELTKTLQRIAPDLILIDNGLHAYWSLMAFASGLKVMYVSPLMPMVEDGLVPPLNSLLEPAHDLRSRIKVRLAWQRNFAGRWLRNRVMRLAGIPDSVAHIKKLARACGYPLRRLNTRTMLFPQLDIPMLITCPEEFDFPQARNRPGLFYGEAAIDPQRDAPPFPWDKLDAGKRLVFCSLGSIAHNLRFLQSVVDATAKEPDWQLVMNIGSTLTRDDFERIPATAILVNGAPQLRLLERAHAMINHGGIGSVRECIYFGVPQVVFPVYFDQFGAASRVRYHRLGTTGSFDTATPESIHALLSEVLGDAGYASRSQAMSRIFQRREIEQTSAVAIERFIAS